MNLIPCTAGAIQIGHRNRNASRQSPYWAQLVLQIAPLVDSVKPASVAPSGTYYICVRCNQLPRYFHIRLIVQDVVI